MLDQPITAMWYVIKNIIKTQIKLQSSSSLQKADNNPLVHSFTYLLSLTSILCSREADWENIIIGNINRNMNEKSSRKDYAKYNTMKSLFEVSKHKCIKVNIYLQGINSIFRLQRHHEKRVRRCCCVKMSWLEEVSI